MDGIYRQMTLDEWDRLIDETRHHLNGMVKSTIIIGHNLRKIRDAEAYKLKGCRSLSEFAEKELGISRSVAARAIQISEKYAIGRQIRPEYAGYGRSLLEAMLGLTEEEEKLITPDTSREDVRELKRFSKNEPEEAVGLEKAVVRFLSEDGEAFQELLEEEDMEGRVDILNPSGNRAYKSGDVYLWLYDVHTGVKYRVFGKTETVEMPWEEFFRMAEGLEAQVRERLAEKKASAAPKGEAGGKIEKDARHSQAAAAPEKAGGEGLAKGAVAPAQLEVEAERVVPAQREVERDVLGPEKGEAPPCPLETETVFEKLKKKDAAGLACWLATVGCPPGTKRQGKKADGQAKCREGGAASQAKCQNCWEIYLNQYEAVGI